MMCSNIHSPPRLSRLHASFDSSVSIIRCKKQAFDALDVDAISVAACLSRVRASTQEKLSIPFSLMTVTACCWMNLPGPISVPTPTASPSSATLDQTHFRRRRYLLLRRNVISWGHYCGLLVVDVDPCVCIFLNGIRDRAQTVARELVQGQEQVIEVCRQLRSKRFENSSEAVYDETMCQYGAGS